MAKKRYGDIRSKAERSASDHPVMSGNTRPLQPRKHEAQEHADSDIKKKHLKFAVEGFTAVGLIIWGG